MNKVGGNGLGSLPPCCWPEPFAQFRGFSPPTLRACLLERRVNLLVAPEEVAAVVDVRRRRRDVLGRRIRAGHRLPQRQAAAAVRVHEPDPHAVPIGRRRSIGAPWLTAVFDIDPEHHAPLGALAIGERVVPRAREADLVGRRAPRLGPADAVARIAQAAHHPRCVRILRTGETGALQAVEAARVEVAVQPLLNVTHMRPFAGDARRVRRERRCDPDRRTHLTSMRGVDRLEPRARTGVGRARARRVGIADGVIRAARIHDPTTGHPAAEQLHTFRRLRGFILALPGGRIALLADGVCAGRGPDVGLHAHSPLAARGRAGVVVGVRARRAVGDVDVRADTLARLAARGLAATGDGRDGVAGVVDRAGRAVRDRDVLGHTHARLDARGLAAAGDRSEGAAGDDGRAGRAVRDVDVGANAHARLAARGLAATGDGRDGVAGVVGRAGRAVRHVDVRANALARLAAGGLAVAGDGRDGVAGVVGRAGRAVRDVDVRANALARLAAGGLAAAGDGRDGVAGVVGRAGRAVGDVDVRANTLARLAAGGLTAAGNGRDGVAGIVDRAGRAVGDRDVLGHTLARLGAGALAGTGDGRDGVAGRVGRAGRAVRDVDVRANTLARLAPGGLAAPGNGGDGVAGVVD